MRKISNKNLGIKFTWLIAAFCAMYIVIWLGHNVYVTNKSAISGFDLNFRNFILPLIVAIIILLIFTKEVFFGFKSIKEEISYKTIFFFVLLELIVCVYLFNPIKYILQKMEGRETALLFAVTTILVSFVGVIWHRLNLPSVED
ncbi:MAG: hypothetical protein HKN51_07115 [Saprospiraceae bacterium]|nr:hypothetical protein [Saprospiraceae bacterium]